MKKNNFLSSLSQLGPGIVLAATGIGSGDMIATAVGGANFGTTILWSVVLGVVLKFSLSEAMARFQLTTGKTILEAWIKYLHSSVGHVFIVYLLLWSFVVAAATISASGLAANALFPQISRSGWAVIHSLAGYILVRFGNYGLLENIMKVIVGAMFVLVVYCAWNLGVDFKSTREIIPNLNMKHLVSSFSILGAVGGSVTLLSYSYWIQEKNWNSSKYLKMVRLDLLLGYVLTACFCIAMVLIASRLNADALKNGNIVFALADQIELASNRLGRSLFIWGFWAAVFSSVLGVWQGVPYIFENYLEIKRKKNSPAVLEYINQNAYHVYLLYLSFPPLILLLFDKPIWIVITYTLVGSLFMPFLALSLVLLNNKSQLMHKYKNGLVSNGVLFACLSIFMLMGVYKIFKIF